MIFLDTVEGVNTTLRPYWAEAIGDNASVVQACPDMLEIVPPGTSKGSGVKILLDHLGVSPKEVSAVLILFHNLFFFLETLEVIQNYIDRVLIVIFPKFNFLAFNPDILLSLPKISLGTFIQHKCCATYIFMLLLSFSFLKHASFSLHNAHLQMLG